MRIAIGKINLRGFECVVNQDGSARFLRYLIDECDNQLLELQPLYDTVYRLTVRLPKLRTVDVVINVVKSSANCYRVVYSDRKRTEISQGLKNYDEVNSFITSLVRQEKN